MKASDNHVKPFEGMLRSLPRVYDVGGGAACTQGGRGINSCRVGESILYRDVQNQSRGSDSLVNFWGDYSSVYEKILLLRSLILGVITDTTFLNMVTMSNSFNNLQSVKCINT